MVKRNGCVVDLQISYREEEERYDDIYFNCLFIILCIVYSLFYGCDHLGVHPINISSIRIISTATNYSEIIQAITLFDNVLSGNMDGLKKIPSSVWSKSVFILDFLINSKDSNEFDPFIYNTFKLFLKQKTKIKFDMRHLNEYVDNSFLDILFGGKV